MPNSDTSGAPATNQEARLAFAQEAMSRWIDIGETLTLPEANQHFRVIGHRECSVQRVPVPDVFLIMAGECFACGEPFSFETHVDLKYLPRTCRKHHHHASLRPEPVKPAPRPRYRPVQDVVVDVVGSYALIQDRVPIDEAVQVMVERLPRRDTSRDLRKQDVRRAIKRLHSTGALGCRIDGDYFVF